MKKNSKELFFCDQIPVETLIPLPKIEFQKCSKIIPLSPLDASQRESFIRLSNKKSSKGSEGTKKRESRNENRTIISTLSQSSLKDLVDSFQTIEILNSNKNHIRFEKSIIMGWGVRTTKKIYEGEPIIEYIGEIVRPIIAERRQVLYEQEGNLGTYIFKLDDNSLLDATKKGGIARFLNHSCDPNCQSKRITLNGRKAIVLFAKRDIEPLEELSYDYFLPYESKEHAIKCCCGSTKCRGWLNWVEGYVAPSKEEQKQPYRNLPASFYVLLVSKKIIPAPV